MRKEDLFGIGRKMLPVVATGVVAVCTVVSLSGYEPPVFAVEKEEEENTEDLESTEEIRTTEQLVDNENISAQGNFEVADGVYEGKGKGFAGEVTVSVEVKNGSIISIDVLSNSDDAAFFDKARGVIDTIIQSQKLDVDTVSGATYSSKGIINAVKNALTGVEDTSSTGSVPQPQGELPKQKDIKEPSAYKNGTYYGTGTGFGGPLKVKVVIKKGKISSIKIVSHSDGDSYINMASSMIKKMISKQTTNVDTVSGATYSSGGIIEAVRDALSQAGTDGKDNKEKEDTKKNTDTTTEVAGTVPYVEGVYYGTAEGYAGKITVAVVIQDNTIKNILVTESSDDAAFFTRTKEVVSNVIKQQNTQVDTVSGATYSSKGLLDAINNALESARKVTNGEAVNAINTATLQATISEAEALTESSYTALSWSVLRVRLQDAKEAMSYTEQTYIDKAEKKLRSAIQTLAKKPQDGESAEGNGQATKYVNGTYPATVACVPDAFEDFETYQLSLKVTVENDRIVSVTDVAGDGDSTKNARYIEWAVNGRSDLPGVVTQILERGTTEGVDAVSKATCSSKSIIEACNQALQSAVR